jgi:hypothetical protein
VRFIFELSMYICVTLFLLARRFLSVVPKLRSTECYKGLYLTHPVHEALTLRVISLS